MSDGEQYEVPPISVLDSLTGLPQDEAITLLRSSGWWTDSVAMLLAERALDRADSEPVLAERGLALASMVATEYGEPPALVGQIAYADARCAVHVGDLARAEVGLLRAQENWRAIDAGASYARSYLGLTQVLAMQGRYDEARVAVQSAIESLQRLVEADLEARLLLSRAHRNRATLLVYQEQHDAARHAYEEATLELNRFANTLSPEEQEGLNEEFGHLAMNLASAYTFLDAPDEAEGLLLEAIGRFEVSQERVNRGRAQTNLGRLYLRLGQYSAALEAFGLAERDLLGELPLMLPVDTEDDSTLAALHQADELLLEHASAYLVLNLLPEATLALNRSERLFRATGQPYELAQSRYALGVLFLQQGAWRESQAALDEALALYRQLGNVFWGNRTQTARARLELALGDSVLAADLLDELLAAPELITPLGAVAWDLLGLVDVWLLRLQMWLDSGEIELAEAAAEATARLLGGTTQAEPVGDTPWPHLALRLAHSRGRIASARGDDALARRHFSAAAELLDRQRASLPLEEVRTAYLDDKMTIYSDWVVSLLATPMPSEDEVAAAFAIVERARSRALLERLLASVEIADENESSDISKQRAALRRQLHWMYNQLSGDSGNRRLDGNLVRKVAQHEAAIQQLEWHNAPLLVQAEPVCLPELQAYLTLDQQALVYYFAGNEVLAFVVGQNSAHVVRRLTTVQAVRQAYDEFRFQLGRAEIGSEYVARHQERLFRGIYQALAELYQQLVAPLQTHLSASRLLLIPYGLLHLIPFHALRVDEKYWLEQVEITYVPSASIAVHGKRDFSDLPLTRFAGFAPYDARIPQAQVEIEAASAYFEVAQAYHHEAATISNMSAAAASVDVLHLATHGLFRPDNSFFSSLKLADGWVDVREIYRLNLSARLVVLSACESGMGEVRAGDEVVGLARGFLAAGTKHLVASLWNVHDSSAAGLMARFYQELQGHAAPSFQVENHHGNSLTSNEKHRPLRPAAALRAAQLNALRTGAHPYYWAPFFAVG